MTCPEVMDLERFVLKQLDEPALSSIAEHVAGCEECTREVAELDENLRLAASLRRESTSGKSGSIGGAKPEEWIGPYRILRQLGQGGMGTVFEAEQDNPRRVVALKMIRAGLVSSSLLARFRHESHVLGRLTHPGIAQIYEAGTHQSSHGPQPYFVMELVHGESVLAYAESRHLATNDRLELIAKICDAVEHAHQRGVIHRDLKPDNILVDVSSGAPQPKILDFGVARIVDPEGQTTTLHTSVGQIVGTVAYMSPEQASANPSEIDTRADVYALGVICYHLLAGQLPYKLNQTNVAESVRTIVQDEPTPLATVVRSLRGDVTTIVGKALEKDKSRRYPSAAAMAEDIRLHLRHEPITAHPPSTIYQLGKFARRNKGLVAGVAAAFVALILGIIGTSIGLVRAQRARSVADSSAITARSEADKAHAINQFLIEMLASANPNIITAADRNKGRDVTVVQVLEEAAVRLDQGSLSSQPAVESAVRRTLADTYIGLGKYSVAEPHLRKALEMDRRTYGADHPEVAVDLSELGVVLHREGRLEEAEASYREGLKIARGTFGERSPQTAKHMTNLAAVVRDRGNYAEAETMFRQTLDVRRALLGDEHRDVTVTMTNLASVLQHLGKLDESEQLLRSALAIREKQLGTEHPEVAHCLVDLSTLMYLKGDNAQAESLARSALAMRRELLGDENPEVAQNLVALAVILSAEGKYEEAEGLLRQSLELNRKLLGADSPIVARSMGNLASVLRAQGRLADAELLHREVLATRRKQLGDDHPDVAGDLNNLAGVLLDQGKFAEAEPLFRESLALRERHLGATHTDTITTRINLGACLRRLERFADAEEQILAGHRALTDTLGPTDRRANWSASHLVKLYEVWGKPELAAKYRAMLPTTAPTTRTAT